MGDFPSLGVAAGAPPRSREELVARNRQLMLDLAEAAGAIGRPDALADFKSMSSAYQRAQLPPAAYLDAFANLFGIAAARRLFPELALLLPDARRRAELEDAFAFERNLLQESEQRRPRRLRRACDGGGGAGAATAARRRGAVRLVKRGPYWTG